MLFGRLRENALKINIKDLIDPVTEVVFEETAEELGFDKKEITLVGPVKCEAEIFNLEFRFRVKGKLAATIDLECGRCLKKIKQKLQPKFDLVYVKDGVNEEGELEGAEVDELVLEGNSLDLDEDVRQTLLLELPMAPVCKESCKGLCSSCGADLNKKKCDCKGPVKNNPFSQIKLKGEK